MTQLPELKRVAKSSTFGGGSTFNDGEHLHPPPLPSQPQQQQIQLQSEQLLTRNMLMNIILRPGGGDKTRALPRPQVIFDINSFLKGKIKVLA
jgi:hypothetical protein